MTDSQYQKASLDMWDKKYRVKDKNGNPIENSIDETYQRIAKGLAEVENPEVREHWESEFLWALRTGAIPAGRISSNVGAEKHKPNVSLDRKSVV